MATPAGLGAFAITVKPPPVTAPEAKSVGAWLKGSKHLLR